MLSVFLGALLWATAREVELRLHTIRYFAIEPHPFLQKHLEILNSTSPCETKVPTRPSPPNNDGVRDEQDFSRENFTSGAKHHCLVWGGGAAGTEFRSGLNDSVLKIGPVSFKL